jgi:hypothetical protein
MQEIQPITKNNVHSSIKTAQQNPSESFWGKDGFTFGDVIDIFNPIQHLPVVANYYRQQTNDDASEGSKVVGGVLFSSLLGGVLGVVTSIANSVVRHETQQDVEEHLIDLADGFINQSNTRQSDNQPHYVKNDKESNLASDSNPFFAQLLDDNLYTENTDLSQASKIRSKEWGKV